MVGHWKYFQFFKIHHTSTGFHRRKDSELALFKLCGLTHTYTHLLAHTLNDIPNFIAVWRKFHLTAILFNRRHRCKSVSQVQTSIESSSPADQETETSMIIYTPLNYKGLLPFSTFFPSYYLSLSVSSFANPLPITYILLHSAAYTPAPNASRVTESEKTWK